MKWKNFNMPGQFQFFRFFCYNKKDKLVILSAYLENDF